MVFIANTGLFYVFDYGFHMMADRFTKEKKFRKMYDSYFDFILVKQKKERSSMPYVLHTGLFFLAISMVFNLGFSALYV